MARSEEQSSARIREQYKRPDNLLARMRLHQRFSTNRYGWHRWVFDQFSTGPEARVLEIGCGTGALWSANRERIPAEWEIVLSDMSDGMLRETRDKLAGIERAFVFERFDVSSIPHPDAAFDAIIANHMLYHVNDRPRALREIRRLFKPSGKLYAATNGRKHLVQLDEITKRFFPGVSPTGHVERFGLETGYEQLARWFAKVEVRRYEDGLVVTEAEPLVDYVLSMSALANADRQGVAALRAYLQAELDRRGVIEISKDAGLFIASAN